MPLKSLRRMADTKWDTNKWKDPEKAPGVDEAAVLRKLNRHIVIKFFLMTVLCYIDRTSLAFAALQLNQALGFTDRVYGLGSGVFFIGYALFQVDLTSSTCDSVTHAELPACLPAFTYLGSACRVWRGCRALMCACTSPPACQNMHQRARMRLQVPSNMMLVRVGAPKWLSFIVVSWGLCASLFAFMQSETEFYVLRFLLGLTECGTFPGMWYYMSLWYSEKDLGMAYSWISAGTALSQVLSLDPFQRMHGRFCRHAPSLH